MGNTTQCDYCKKIGVKDAPRLLKKVFEACSDHLGDFHPHLYSEVQKLYKDTIS